MNIFDRKMTLLSRVTLTPEELTADNMAVVAIRDFTNPTNQAQHAATIAKIRALCPDMESKAANKKTISALKKQLPAGIISGVAVGGIDEAHITERNGVIAIDIDQADNPTITDWDSFKWAFGCLDFVAYCGLSVSGRGVWALVPISNPEAHGEHFKALQEELAHTALNYFEYDNIVHLEGVKIDAAPSNVASKRFLSYDSEPHINPRAAEYTKRVCIAPVQLIFQRIFSNRTPNQPTHTSGEPFNLVQWFNRYGIQYTQRPRHGGQQYIVQCPWSDEHTSGESKADSAVFVDAAGRIGYKCHHSHCAGRHWQEYRAFYEH